MLITVEKLVETQNILSKTKKKRKKTRRNYIDFNPMSMFMRLCIYLNKPTYFGTICSISIELFLS